MIFGRSKVNIPSESTARPIFNICWKFRLDLLRASGCFVHKQTDRHVTTLAKAQPCQLNKQREYFWWLLLHIPNIWGVHLFLLTILRVMHCEFYHCLPLPRCFPAAQCSACWRQEVTFSCILQDIYLLILNNSSNHYSFTIITWNVQLQPVFWNYWSHLAAWTLLLGPNGVQVPLSQPDESRAPSSEEKVSFK